MHYLCILLGLNHVFLYTVEHVVGTWNNCVQLHYSLLALECTTIEMALPPNCLVVVENPVASWLPLLCLCLATCDSEVCNVVKRFLFECLVFFFCYLLHLSPVFLGILFNWP